MASVASSLLRTRSRAEGCAPRRASALASTSAMPTAVVHHSLFVTSVLPMGPNRPRLRPRPAHHAAWRRAGVLAILQHLPAVHPHMADANRVLMRLLVGRPVRNRLRIEDDNVGE